MHEWLYIPNRQINCIKKISELITIVKIMESELDRVTSRLFLISVKKWYNEDGIKMGVEKVSNLFANKNDAKKRGIAVTCSILEDMEKCRVRKIENGKLVMKEDEDTGEEKVVTEIVDDVEEVTFFFNVKISDEENNEFSVNPKSSCYPLFNFAFQESGDLPQGNTKGFICNIEELKEALEGLEFMGKEEDWSFSGGKPYQVLIPSDIQIKKEKVEDE